MTTEKMTIHEALSELKVIGSRIEKEIAHANFVITNKHSNDKINGQSIEDYKANVTSTYQKIRDLIRRRTAIKKAVVKSNAVTEVTIGDETMTVAEAIEYKNTGIDYLVLLNNKMINEYTSVKSNVTRANGDALIERANDHIIRLYGGKEKDVSASVIEEARTNFISMNSLDIIDPINVDKEINSLTDYIDNFRSKVDSALSVSNATTIIEVTY